MCGNRIDTGRVWVVMSLGGAAAVLWAGAHGCTQSVSLGEDCASATVSAASGDPNNTFSQVNGNQCDASIQAGSSDGTFVLEIDILDRDTGSVNPRVLFTLDLDAGEVPVGQTIDLTRANDVDLAPAVYQEVDVQAAGGTTADPSGNIGPFWSSSSGSITFTEQTDGSILGTFEFLADNPSSENNDAVGGLRVEGTVTLNSRLVLDTPCGLTSVPLGAVTLFGLSLLGWRRRRRVRNHAD